MSNKVISGVVNCSGGGHAIEADGIHGEHGLVVRFPIRRITLFIGRGYVGLFNLREKGIFYFSRSSIAYRYFVGSKTLQVTFDGEKL